MTTSTTSSTPLPDSLAATQQALLRLREQYRQHHDLFSQKELARLSFVRWLYQTGRLLP